MFGSSKQDRENREYRDGYESGRDADPLKRGFDHFFGFTRSDTTYGKGYEAGRQDRYQYGSRPGPSTKQKQSGSRKGRSPKSPPRESASSDTSSGGSIGFFEGFGLLIVIGLIINVFNGDDPAEGRREPVRTVTTETRSFATLGEYPTVIRTEAGSPVRPAERRTPEEPKEPSPETIEARLRLDPGARKGIQRALRIEGANPGPADGIFGPKTRRAIRSWQRSKGLPVTGYLDRRQVAFLERRRSKATMEAARAVARREGLLGGSAGEAETFWTDDAGCTRNASGAYVIGGGSACPADR